MNLRLYQVLSLERTQVLTCIYNCRSSSRGVPIDHLQEAGGTLCNILGSCETRQKVELNVTWRNGNTVHLDEGQGQRRVGGIGFVINRSEANHLPVSLAANRFAFPLARFQQDPQSRSSLRHHSQR